MSKLVYGENGQVRFFSEEEKREAIDYILNNPQNVDFTIHENNQNQGAWGSEDRIHFIRGEGVPECLKRNMTAGRPGLYGRINCKEFCQELREIALKRKVSK
ncbi:hypothetical protein [Segatella bryantii]|uniref:hypothetical protein n=1 Tax=Segatella bryantii TaxID=77095 RepID=UPI00242E5FA3|nr:hypothetical protein [Segatella bryantii]